MIKILLADDDVDILDLLKYNFEKEGYQVFVANNGEDAISIAKKELPDVILLDIMMPVMDGIEASRRIKSIADLQNKIIIFLTARTEEYSEMAGFEAGADDYITKPIKMRVLNARIKNLLKRIGGKTEQTSEGVLKFDDLIVSKNERLVYINDNPINLPKKEFEILLLLVSKPGNVFTREQIYNTIWGNDAVVSERTLDVHIRKLREKIGEQYIRTSKGVGYSFMVKQLSK